MSLKNDCSPGLFSNQLVFTSVWLSKFYIGTNVTSLNSFGSFAALPALYWILCTLLSLAHLPIVYPLWFISTFILHTVLGPLNFFSKKKKNSKDLESVCGGRVGEIKEKRRAKKWLLKVWKKIKTGFWRIWIRYVVWQET